MPSVRRKRHPVALETLTNVIAVARHQPSADKTPVVALHASEVRGGREIHEQPWQSHLVVLETGLLLKADTDGARGPTIFKAHHPPLGRPPARIARDAHSAAHRPGQDALALVVDVRAVKDEMVERIALENRADAIHELKKTLAVGHG